MTVAFTIFNNTNYFCFKMKAQKIRYFRHYLMQVSKDKILLREFTPNKAKLYTQFRLREIRKFFIYFYNTKLHLILERFN